MTPETTIAEAEADITTTTAGPSEPTDTPHATEKTTCTQCTRVFDWRDEVYAHAATMGICKHCQQRGAHARLGVVAFHPATREVTHGEKLVSVPVTQNRATRRGQGNNAPTRPSFDPAIAPRTRKPTRAERRAAAQQSPNAHRVELGGAAPSRWNHQNG